jgi:spore coat polysaccharide biosynthesis protein SpsF (cytidylyltransferase family)
MKEHIEKNVDLTMFNNMQKKLPFNCYVVKTNALEKVVNNKTAHDTEVWLKYFLSDNEIIIHTIDPGKKYCHSSLKTSIDYPEDYEFMKRVFDELHKPPKVFSMLDIIDLVNRKPYILDINSNPYLLDRWCGHQEFVK